VRLGFLADYSHSWFTRLSLCLCGAALLLLTGCSIPDPPPSNLPTAPAVLDITPAPTLNVNATATSYASLLRPSPTPAGLYIVRSGDTLSGLANQYGTTVEAILAANGLADPNALQIGQALIIPSLLATPMAQAPNEVQLENSPTPIP
jgi:LysM repeat protein